MKPIWTTGHRRAHWATLATMACLGALAATGVVRAQQQPIFDLPDGVGKDKVAAACSTCHAITQVTSQIRSAPQWAQTVDQMISRGAPVPEEDYPVIVEYLAKYFGPAAKDAPAPAATPGAPEHH